MELKKVFETQISSEQICIEIIIPSFNNCFEITENFYHFFNLDEVKITILERNINEDILALSKFRNVNLYERLSDDLPELYFIYYVSTFFKERHSFVYIYADEFVSVDSLAIFFNKGTELIFLNRYECFYNQDSGLYSRQLRGGSYNAIMEVLHCFNFKKSFHDFWTYNDDGKFLSINIKALHLHKYDVLSDYGKSSKYVFEELKMLKKIESFNFYFIKRFYLRFFSRFLNIKLLLKNVDVYLYLLFAQIIESSNAMLFILEDKLKKRK